MKMQALVASGPNVFGMAEIEVPSPGPDEVLCRIRSVALCGSDPGLLAGNLVKRGWPPVYPFVFGHEWAGEVVETGSRVQGFSVNDRVAGEPHCGCGVCTNCRTGNYNLCLKYGVTESGHRHYGFLNNGAFAQYGVFRQNTLHHIPDGVSFDEATLCDAAGVALHGLRMVSIAPPCTVAIYGPGPIGCLAAQIAKANGAKIIMVGRGARLQKALEAGADEGIDYEVYDDPAAEIIERTDGFGADVVVESSGTSKGLYQGIPSAARNGHVVLLGYYKDEEPVILINLLHVRQLHLHGSRANPNCADDVLKLIRQKAIHPGKLITHTYHLAEFNTALQTFTQKERGALKVVLHP